MGKKSSSPPPSPDYVGVAQTQGQLDKEAAVNTTWANRPTVTTPFGSQSWNSWATTDPATGTPVTAWQTNIGLNPGLQSALNSQINVQGGRSKFAEDLLGRVEGAYADPVDYSQFEGYGQVGDPTTSRDRALETINELRAPNVAQRRDALETQLANQGIYRGSEAYTRSMSDLGDQEHRGDLLAFMQADDAATNQLGRELRSAEYANALRQMQIGEAYQRRGQPLNELNALLSGQQVNMPQIPNFQRATGYNAPDLLGATMAGYDAQLGAYNAEQAGRANSMSGLYDLVGIGARAAFGF